MCAYNNSVCLKMSEEKDIKALKASRGYAKAALTRLYNFATNLEEVNSTTLSTLQAKRDRVSETFGKYENYNEKILGLDEQDCENVEEIETKFYTILSSLNEAIQAKTTPISEVVSNSSFSAKLPKIEIKPFNGKYSEYNPFINLFNAIIHKDRAFDNIQRLYYLRTFLEGEPFDLIKNLPLEPGSYDEALNLLNDRYNHKFKIVNEHINSLLDLNALSKSTPTNLREFISIVKQCLASLKNLQINTETWDPILLSILFRKLDLYTLRAYQLERSTDSDPTVVDFLRFLERRALAMENAEPPLRQATSRPTREQKAVVNITTTAGPNTCAHCKSEHKLFACNEFKTLPYAARIKLVKDKSLCNVCLNNHKGKCKFHFKCHICKEAHHTILHDESSSSSNPVTLISNTQTDRVLLPTVKVKLYSQNGTEVHVKAILDSASQVSLVTSKVLDVLGKIPNKDETNIVGVSNASNIAKYSVPLEVFSLATNYRVTINCHVLDKITCKIPQFKVDMTEINIPKEMILADDDFYVPSEINMLIGADEFFQALLSEQRASTKQRASRSNEQQQPRFINTRFGHVIAGALPQHTQRNSSKVSLLCLDYCKADLDNTLQQFFETEKVPETFSEKISENDLCENNFKSTTVHNDNKFQVDLPLKLPLNEINDSLGNSFEYAFYRFLSLERKLHKSPNLLSEYEKFINEYIDLGHGQYLDFNKIDFQNEPLYFMPHHAVINENSKSTKTRVVFDASMQTDKKVSLNDLLLNGPPVQKELFDIMLLFRLGEYTFSTDIRRMFRCVALNPAHTSLQNILWRSDVNDNIKCIRLKTVTYGQKSSSYLATRCLHELATKYETEFPLASYILRNCTYVDDACYAHSDKHVVIEAKRQLCELLEKGSFYTHKWASNCSDILVDIPLDKQQFDDLDLQKNDLFLKTLGLTLNVANDCFVFSCPEPFQIETPTKREILSYISKFYDPLGFMSPVIMKAKSFMQKVWCEKCGWDQVPPQPLLSEWLSFAKKLTNMKPLTIERNIQIPNNVIAVQLIGFADASSTTGYGCCLYLRVVDDSGKATTSLLCSKSRINPRDNKALTIPRLELNAMLLLTKLTNRVYDTLKLKIKINNVYLFSDSQIALAWIATECMKLNAYVANRVKLIRDLTNRWRWLYVHTKENPADLVSRGADPDELIDCELWWLGPQFLGDGKYDFLYTPPPATDDLPEVKKTVAPSSTAKVSLLTRKDDFFSFRDRFSDLNKMTRTMAYILRFCHNLKNKTDRKTGTALSPSELTTALNRLLQYEQSIHFTSEINSLKNGENVNGSLKPLHPFLDGEGILRVGGRIENSTVKFSQKHPIVLPKESRITDLIINHEHLRLLHAAPRLLLSSLNQKYWIVNAYKHVKKLVHKCLLCFRMKADCARQLMGSLPPERITACRSFQKVGIDFAGAFQIKNSSIRRAVQSKGYVCVFVCFVTKAVHLELTSDISTANFLACFKRFIARRGLPTDIFCDNGGCFRGAKNELTRLYELQNSQAHQTQVQNFATQQGIAFHFTPSYSPVFAGLAEAAVKSMKFHLKRILQNYVLTYEQFNTVLCQIEAVLNSRPLLPVVADDVNDFSYLTPGHWLIGTALTSFPERNVVDLPTNRIKFWDLCNKIKTQFWNVWHKYYLNTLQCRPKWRDSMPNVKEGNLVILREPNSPPLSWPMARIVKVYPGKDNKVRVVDVITPNKKVYKRSLSNISILPLE